MHGFVWASELDGLPRAHLDVLVDRSTTEADGGGSFPSQVMELSREVAAAVD